MPALNPARWAELSPQIDELLTLPPLQRAQRLDAIAANDPGTAADLRALLAASDDASRAGFMGTGAAAGFLPAANVAAQAGQVLGAWTLVEPIGEGGMGAVWRARRSDGRYDGAAAIKLLKSGLFDSAAQERFRREGGILARLRHPGIAQLLDAGVSPQGQPYLVLELVQGQRIDRWCEARALNVRQRVELFLQVLEAVQAAHAQLTIHRDLKPSNILVDDSGRVKLLDFGIARLLPGATGDDGQAEPAALTREGSFALTPEYAAPEQFEGDVLSVATDVYALGMVLFELLTLRQARGLPAGAGALQHGLAALEDSALRASSVAPQSIRQSLRGDLDSILAHALRRSAADRYASAAALAEDLRRHLDRLPVRARPDSVAYRAGRFVQRHRVGSLLGTLALVAVLSGLAGTVVQARRADAAARTAAQERDAALRELGYAESARDLLDFVLGGSGSRPMTAGELLTRAEALADKQFAREPALRARMQTLVGAALAGGSSNGRSLALLERAASDAALAQDAVVQSLADCAWALPAIATGQLAAAYSRTQAAIARLDPTRAADRAALAQCHTSRAFVLSAQGQHEPALASAEAGLRWLGTPRPGQRTLWLDALAARGEARGKLGDLRGAMDDLGRVVTELGETGRDGSVQAADIHTLLAEKHSTVGQPLKARELYRRALDIDIQLARSPEPSPVKLGNLAQMTFFTGGVDEALALLERARAGLKTDGSQNLRLGAVCAQMVTPLLAAGRHEEAQARLTQARDLLTRALPPGHNFLSMLAAFEARVAAARGQHARAMPLWEKALPAVRRAPDGIGSGEIGVLAGMARSEQALGQGEAARTHAAQAVTLARERLGKIGITRSYWTGLALVSQGLVALAQDQREAGESALREALLELAETASLQSPPAVEAQARLAALHPVADRR